MVKSSVSQIEESSSTLDGTATFYEDNLMVRGFI
jgi:hypothetical protein